MTYPSLAIGMATSLICLSSSAIVYTNPANGHEYFVTPTATSWFDAQAYAQSQGGYLATITSAQEQDWMMSTVGLPEVVTVGGVDPAIWLGASDAASEGTWTWVTGEPWSYSHWYPGEPIDNSAGGPTGEDYLNMWTLPVTHRGYWNDFDAMRFGSSQLILYGLVERVPEPSGLLTLGIISLIAGIGRSRHGVRCR